MAKFSPDAYHHERENAAVVVLAANGRMGTRTRSHASNRHHVAAADQGASLLSVLDSKFGLELSHPILLIVKRFEIECFRKWQGYQLLFQLETWYYVVSLPGTHPPVSFTCSTHSTEVNS